MLFCKRGKLMKLLKIKTLSDYKMLKKGFEINFLTKTRVDKESNNDDLIELFEGLYYPKETIFVGKNSSGKTTVLELIYGCLQIAYRGRIYHLSLPAKELFSVEMIIYHGNKLYKYIGSFQNQINNEVGLVIKHEELYESECRKTHNKELTNVTFKETKDFIPNIDTDTSSLVRYLKTGEYNTFPSLFESKTYLFGSYIRLFKCIYSEDAFLKLIKVFDDSIESLDIHTDEEGKETDYFDFKRIGEDTTLVTESFLNESLSCGTIRGINLYTPALISFKSGGTIIVDELEKNFNKNLIANLIMMFNDPSINKGNASIIYSTHYSELLDENERCDNINVLHRDGTSITLKNMCTDYNTRTDMLKSNQFDQNAFDNNINYNLLMDLKKELRK